jgi:hypothetical protein
MNIQKELLPSSCQAYMCGSLKGEKFGTVIYKLQTTLEVYRQTFVGCPYNHKFLMSVPRRMSITLLPHPFLHEPYQVIPSPSSAKGD